MCQRYLSVMLVALLISPVCGRAALAATPTKTGTARNERLQATVSKLVRDAKAERSSLLVAAVPQAPAVGSGNHLSKSAKIAIGVGVVTAILVVIFVVKSPLLNNGR